MKTSIVYMRRGNKQVNIVGCIHVGSKEYYNYINSILEKNNSLVLYEGCIGLDKSAEIYRKFAKSIGLEYQNDCIINGNNPLRINSDIHYDILKTAMGKDINFSVFDKIDVLLNNLTSKQINALLNIAFFIAGLKSIKPNPVIVMLRNFIVFRDLFENLELNNNVCILYGDLHVKHMVNYLKSIGFNVIKKEKVTAF